MRMPRPHSTALVPICEDGTDERIDTFDWQQVLDRTFEPWDGAILVDTAKQTVEASVSTIKELLN